MLSFSYSRSGRRKFYFGEPTTPKAKYEAIADTWFRDIEVKSISPGGYARFYRSSKCDAIGQIFTETQQLATNPDYGGTTNLANLYEGKENDLGQMELPDGTIDPNPPSIFRDERGSFYIKGLSVGTICRVITINQRFNITTDSCGNARKSEPTRKFPTGWALDGTSISFNETIYHLDDAVEGTPYCRRMYNSQKEVNYVNYVPA